MHPTPIRRIAPLVAAASLVLTGCDVSESRKPVDPAPTNPTSIAPGQAVTGNAVFKWSPGADTIRIAFHADSGTTYFFRTGSYYGYAHGNILSANMTQSDIDWATPAETGWRDSLIFPCIRSGTNWLLVTVTGYDPVLSSKVDFKADMSSKPGISGKFQPPDAYETDDTKSTAKPLVADGSAQFHTIHGATTNPRDVDWIAIPCDSGRTYKVVHTTTDGKSSLSLFTPDSTAIDPLDRSFGTDMWAGPNSYSFAALRTARYYVKVSTSGGSSAYSLSVTSTQGLPAQMVPDIYEPDSTRATAKSISTDSAVQVRSINGTGKFISDIDWIAFSGIAGKTYTVHYSKTAQTTPWVALYTPDSVGMYDAGTSSVCDSNYGDGICTRTFTARQTGIFHIKVDSYLAAIAYRIAVTSD